MGKERDPNERLRQQETARRDDGDSGLATMTSAAYGNFRGRQWGLMTVALINNGTLELAADNNGEGTRAFVIYYSGNNF